MKIAETLETVYIYIYISQNLIKIKEQKIEKNVAKLCILDECKNRLEYIVFLCFEIKSIKNVKVKIITIKKI